MLITDREFSKVVKEALALAKVKPLVIDYDDPEYSGAGERLGRIEYEEFVAEGDPDFAWQMPDDEWDAIALNYTSGTTGDPKGVVYHHRGAHLLARRQRRHLRHGPSIRSISGRCRCSTATAGASRGRSRWSPARMCACARCARKAMYDAIAEPQGHASVRRADRDVDAAQRAGRTRRSRCRMWWSSSPRPRRRPRRCSPR